MTSDSRDTRDNLIQAAEGCGLSTLQINELFENWEHGVQFDPVLGVFTKEPISRQRKRSRFAKAGDCGHDDDGGFSLGNTCSAGGKSSSGKMTVDDNYRNEEVDNFLEENPDAKTQDIQITGILKEKVLSHLDYWKRSGMDSELAKVESIRSSDRIPPPIIQFYKSGKVGIPDGFHRVAAYILSGKKSIRGYVIGRVPEVEEKTRFAKAGDADDCGYESDSKAHEINKLGDK